VAVELDFRAPLWRWEGGKSAWFFITLPKEATAEIQKDGGHKLKPFGSVRVTARIGSTRWQTSLFPAPQLNSYLLPVKATVREKEQLREGDEVEVLLIP
jgi:hypothetical protein